MEFVVDSNILFALANQKSTANYLVNKFSFKLISPKYALEELSKYKEDLVKKSGFNSFQEIINFLKNKVVFIKISTGELKSFALKISDKDDIIYLFLAKRYNLPIWSNDKHLKEQKEIPIFTTKELIEIFG